MLLAIAEGQAPLSQTTLARLDSIPGARPTISTVRSSMEELQRIGLPTRSSTGARIDDPLFAEYLLNRRSRGTP